MAIRLLARELYRQQKVVEDLERRLAVGPPADQEEIKEALRKARAERNHLRRALDGKIGR